MPLRSSLKAMASVAALAAALTLAQPVARAQYLYLEDRTDWSTVEGTGEIEGSNAFYYCAGLAGWCTTSDTVLWVAWTDIPGATIPSYTDCNCNSVQSSAISGYFTFEPQSSFTSATSENPSYFTVDALWELDQPEYYTTSCGGCPNCDNANCYYQGSEYYATVGSTYYIYVYD